MHHILRTQLEYPPYFAAYLSYALYLENITRVSLIFAAYLSYAPCMKRVYTGRELCGQHYQYLADLVQGAAAPHHMLCWWDTTPIPHSHPYLADLFLGQQHACAPLYVLLTRKIRGPPTRYTVARSIDI